MSFVIDAACSCNIGKVRSNNEDNFLFDGRCMPRENCGLRHPVTVQHRLRRDFCVAVFDGMGGESYGEYASFAAAQMVKETLCELTQYVISEKQLLEKMITNANRKVLEEAQHLGADRMGTTAVIAFFSKKQVYIANIGDSRAYRYRKGEFLQLSKDHTDAALLKERGITGRRPRLTQYLGIDEQELLLEPWISKGKVEKGDIYLLCSDGVTDMLSNFEMADILHRENNAEQCAEQIINAAIENGGRDNITAIVCRII